MTINDGINYMARIDKNHILQKEAIYILHW